MHLLQVVAYIGVLKFYSAAVENCFFYYCCYYCYCYGSLIFWCWDQCSCSMLSPI